MLFIRLLKSTLYDCWIIIGPLGIFLVGNALFVVLQGLNIMWFTTICRMVYDTIARGQVNKTYSWITKPWNKQ